MDNPAELRARAAHFRELASYITDAQARRSIMAIAERSDALAADLEAASQRDQKLGPEDDVP